MKKEYQKPEADFVSLVTEEILTNLIQEDFVDGEMGTASSIF